MPFKSTYQRWKSQGLCAGCGGQPRPNKVLCEICQNKRSITKQNPKYKPQQLASRRKWYSREKERVINHYGGKCACCGETDLDILTLDHINEDGAADRLARTGKRQAGVTFYRKLVQANYPDGFQVLCYNHNIKKYRSGSCCEQHRREDDNHICEESEHPGEQL